MAATHPLFMYSADVAITAHWIDSKFILHEALLAFQQVKASHTGEHLAEVVYDIVDRFGLCDDLFCITSDNAFNNDKMYESLARLLLVRQGIEWDANAMHVRCMNHTINLAVQAFLKDLKVLRVRKRTFSDSDDCQSEGEEDDDDVEDEEDDFHATPTMFTDTLSKLRSIAKVQPVAAILFYFPFLICFGRYKC